MDNLSWDNPSTIRNGINIIPSCIWGSQFDQFQDPKAIFRAIISNELAEINSLDLQGIIFPHDVTENSSKADPGFLQQQEEIMLGASSAGERLASKDQLLPLPLMTCSYEGLQVIRNLQTFSSGGGSNASSSESEQQQHSPNPENQFSSKRKRKDYSDREFRIISGDSNRSKVDNSEPSGIGFWGESSHEPAGESLAQVKEMIYRAAALRPVNLGVEEVVERPKRKNVRISDDPQTAAARHRRERISKKLRVLQRLVPGGSRMDTASMLDEAANYLKFLKAQVIALERLASMKSGGGVNGGCRALNPIPVANSSH